MRGRNRPNLERLQPTDFAHPPRFLLLYGSLRERSFSRLMIEEADRLLRSFGAETRIFDPRDLPQPDSVDPSHPKVQELRAASLWSEGHPASAGRLRFPAAASRSGMQVNAGSQSFNTVNQLRVLGRWMRMITIPNQSSVAKAFNEFDEDGRMKPSPYYDRLVDVIE